MFFCFFLFFVFYSVSVDSVRTVSSVGVPFNLPCQVASGRVKSFDVVVLAFLSSTLRGSLGIGNCTLTHAFHGVRGLRVGLFSSLPGHMGSHTSSSEDLS